MNTPYSRYHTIVGHRAPQVDRVIIELRRRRVSYRAISESLDVLTGLRLTQGHVKLRCYKLGLERDHRRGGFRA